MELGKSYRILGVPSDADMGEVKNAFKHLALQYHPDRNKSPEAPRLFAAINEAYNEILNSQGIIGTSKRAHYYEDILGTQRGRLVFSIMTDDKEIYHHASAPEFESAVRREFNPNSVVGSFCKIGKRWFQIDSESGSTFSFLGRSGNRGKLIEWYKASDGNDRWKTVGWEDFWSYVRRYASHAADQIKRNEQQTPRPNTV
jgi:DnaJ-class molecular chaperone